MSISPFMAGVHGFLVRRQQVKDAQALQEHELNLVRTKAVETHKASQMFTPRLYVPDGSGGRAVLRGSDGNEALFDLNEVNSLEDLTSLSNTYMDVRRVNYANMDDSQKAFFDSQGASLIGLVNDRVFHAVEGNMWKTDFSHEIMSLGLGSAGNNNAYTKEEGKITVTDGKSAWKIPEVQPEYLKLMPDANKYKNTIWKNKRWVEGPDDTPYSTEELWTGYQLSQGTQFYHEVKSGRLSQPTADYLVNLSYYFHGGDDSEDQNARDNFVYNVMESITRDILVNKISGVDQYEWNAVKFLKGRVDITAKAAKASSAREGISTGYKMLTLMENWRSDMKDQPIPGGIFGKWQGAVSSFLAEGGGKEQIVELGKQIVEGLGINFEKGGLDKFVARVEEGISRDRIEEIGMYRAAYEVYEEILAYQMAAALQGGTGGRTISDQDVVNIKRALGNSLFVNGRFQIHRMEAVISMLETINSVNQRYADIGTVGQYHATRAYEKYIWGVGLAREIGESGMQPNAIYPDGQLSRRAVQLSKNVFLKADLRAGIENLHNEAAVMMQDPSLWEQGKEAEAEGEGTELQYKETDFGYTYRNILDKTITANVAGGTFSGTVNELLEKRKAYLDEEGKVRSDGKAEVIKIDAVLNAHLPKNKSPK